MAAIVEQLPPRLLLSATALAASSGLNAWSAERIQALHQEAVARFHYEARVSAQLAHQTSDQRGFEAIPLVPVQVVRVRFRDIGQLPPMDLEDETGEFIDE